MSDITQFLDRARRGDGTAWEDVVELLYADLNRLVRGAIGSVANNTMGATGLVHECYERLARTGALGVRDRCHFLSLSARIMRQILINHARDRIAAKRGGGAAPAYAEVAHNLDEEAEGLLHLDLSLRQLEAVDARLVYVVECRIFAGLSEEETTQAMQVLLRARDQLRELLIAA